MMRSVYIRLRIASISFRNELKAIFTDRGALLILLGACVIYPIAYSIAYSKDVLRDTPIALVDLDNTSTSRLAGRMIDATEKLKISHNSNSLKEAEKLFWDGEVKGVVLINSEFEKQVLKGQAAGINIYCDASYFLLYKETLTATMAATGTFSAGVEIKRFMASGSSLEQSIEKINPIQTKYYSLYNPSGSYGAYVMPGMIIVILQQTLLIGIGMISGASREKRAHFIMPGLHFKGGTFSTILGKAMAYFCIGLLTSTFTLIWVYDWFGFPSKSNPLDIFILITPFLLSTIFLGLAISFLFHKREQSIMFLVFLSPIVLFLSGISWPIEAIPPALQKIAALIPSSHMMPAYLRIRTMGVELLNVKSEIITLYTQAFIYLLLAALMYKIMKKRHLSQYKVSKVLDE